VDGNTHKLETTRPIDVAAAQRLLNTLHLVLELEDRLQTSYLQPQHHRSLLSADLAAGNAASAANCAAHALASAIDHLRTWYYLIAGDIVQFSVPILSHYTLARATYEASLHALWLLDPNVDSRERIGRGYAMQLQSLKDMGVYQKSAGMTGSAANAATLYERLWEAATREGYVRVTAKARGSKSRDQLTHTVPSMGSLFDLYDVPPASGAAQARGRYNLMSGLAHSRHWAIAGIAADVSTATPDGHVLQINFPLVCSLADSTTAIAERAVSTFIYYRAKPASL
jgi:hypothetical protein